MKNHPVDGNAEVDWSAQSLSGKIDFWERKSIPKGSLFPTKSE